MDWIVLNQGELVYGSIYDSGNSPRNPVSHSRPPNDDRRSD